MSEYIIELDSKRSIALMLALAEEARGGDAIREEIVRCIDCKRFDTDDYGCAWCNWVCASIQPDDYCAWGERK